MHRLFASVMSMCLVFALLPLTAGTVTAQERVYDDPAGRFSVPVPPDWTDESKQDVGRYVSSDGLAVSILVVEAVDAASGDQSVLMALAPELVGTAPAQAGVVSAANGIWNQSIYALEDGRLMALVTQWVDNATYALVFDAPGQAAFGTHEDAMVGMMFGATVGEQVDLAGIQILPFTEAMVAELEAYIESARERFHIPGVSIAVVQNGEIVYMGGFGTTEPNGGHPVTPETLFMIGSITKSMTTMMMGTLVDDGVLDWDQPVTEILPSFALSDAGATDLIRVRDLVNMSSGVPAYDTITALADYSPQDLIASLVDIPMVAAPGDTWNYNNQMVVAGGYLAALASGTPADGLYEGYVDLMQARVFDPIAMPDTTFDFDTAIADEDHALSFAYNPMTGAYLSVPMTGERGVLPVAPAGAVWSNAADMARYLQTELDGGIAPDGVRVISEAALSATQSQEIAIAGTTGYGMGWFVESYKGLPLIWHGGNTRAFTSDLAFLPGADLGIVILTNAAEANNFYKSVREYTFELAFGLGHESSEGFAAAQDARDQEIAAFMSALPGTVVDGAEVESYLGLYEHSVSVERRGDEVWLVGAFVQEPLHPAAGLPGSEAGDFILTVEFNAFRVRFLDEGGRLGLQITSLWTGEMLTLDKVA